MNAAVSRTGTRSAATRALTILVEIVLGAAIVYAMAVVLEPVARTACERSAVSACARGEIAHGRYDGNAYWGRCRVDCEPRHASDGTGR